MLAERSHYGTLRVPRFPKIYGQSRAGYSQRLRAEIKAVFGVTLSGKCLRPLLKSLRAELRQELNESGVEKETQKRETACVGLPEPPSVIAGEVLREPLPAAPSEPSPPVIRKESPVLPLPDPGQSVVGFCHQSVATTIRTCASDLPPCCRDCAGIGGCPPRRC